MHFQAELTENRILKYAKKKSTYEKEHQFIQIKIN